MQTLTHKPKNRTSAHRGFTLMELLVVIVIIAVLSVIGFTLSRQVNAKLQATQAVHRIRQCGAIVLQKASENHNHLIIHANGTSSNMHDLRLHGMVKEALMDGDVSELVYTPAYQKYAKGTWPVWGVNLDDNPELGVEWERVWFERGGDQRFAEGLRLPKCKQPGRYPLLADSSNGAGVPRARFANDNQHKFAMRYRNKGPVFLLDGSTVLVGPGSMNKFGITQGYLFESGPQSEPILVRASRDRN